MTSASTAATTASAVSATPPTATTAALCLGTRFIHHEVPPAEILAVQRVHRAVRVFVIAHFDEREPARLPSETVANQIYTRGSYANLRERSEERRVGKGWRAG